MQARPEQNACLYVKTYNKWRQLPAGNTPTALLPEASAIKLKFPGGIDLKKTALFTAVFLLLSVIVPVPSLSAEQGIIHREIEEMQIARNVVYKTITRFTDLGWDRIHLLEADISDRHTRLDLLTPPGGVGTASTLPEMVKDSETIAAINGDFFISGETYSPIGPLVRDGKMQSSPTYRMEELAVFSLDSRKVPIIDYWKWETKLYIGDFEFPVSAINKISSEYAYPVVYTEEWGDNAPPASFDDILYVIVQKNRVKDIIQGASQEIPIPEKGMVIMARGDTASGMLQVLKPGSSVSLETITTPDFEKMDLAIGGGTILVKDGALYPFTHSIEGSHPRTAIGFSKDGKKVIAAAVEGRIKGARGMNQTELARLMIELGAYQAINLDGGGSTTMLARKPGDEVLTVTNTPSDGTLRRISNGISINSTAPRGSLRHILLEAVDTNVFTGTGRTLSVKGCDSNYNPVDIDINRVNWSVSGVEGYFDRNVFYPLIPGKAVITANYMGRSADITLKVLDEPVMLSAPDVLKTDLDKNLPLSIYGRNISGYSALIENRDLSLQATIGRIQGQDFLSGSREGTGEIRIAFNGLSCTVPVSVGYQRVVLDSFEVLRGSFTSYPSSVTGHYTLDTRHPFNGKSSGRLAYDFTATDVTAASYLEFDGKGITLDAMPERLGIYAYSPEENSHWLRMMLEDSKGVSVTLDLARGIDWTGYKFLDVQVPRTLVPPIFIKRVYIVETNPIMNDAGEIYLDDLTALYPYTVQPQNNSLKAVPHDPQRVNEAPGDHRFAFSLFGSTGIRRLIDIHVVNRMKQRAREAGSLAVFSGNVTDEALNDLGIPVISTTGGYSVTRQENNTFLQLDNKPGGLRAYSPQQWHWLKQQLGSISSGNLFVVLPRPVWDGRGFTDTLEAELLHSFLSDLHGEKGVNVYVLTGGWSTFSYDIRDGIRYIGINGTDVPSPSSTDLENYSFLRFYIAADGTVTYQVVPLFGAQPATGDRPQQTNGQEPTMDEQAANT